MSAGYATLWEFAVRPGREAEFERGYGPEGAWAQLFRRARGYLGTELLRDCADPLRYVTVDRWESAEAFRAFRDAFAAEYARLDREFEPLTAREAPLGEFATAAAGPR